MFYQQEFKIYLEKMNSNIQVYLHPNRLMDIMWSMHQKYVVIDQQLVYLGGIDICYGRYDTPEHLLYDRALVEKTGELFPGQDYHNDYIEGYKDALNYKARHLSRDKPRNE